MRFTRDKNVVGNWYYLSNITLVGLYKNKKCDLIRWYYKKYVYLSAEFNTTTICIRRNIYFK